MLEEENYKQILTKTGGSLKNKEMLRDENCTQVRTTTREPLGKKQKFREKKGKQLRTYADVVSTGKLINEREVSVQSKSIGMSLYLDNPY